MLIILQEPFHSLSNGSQSSVSPYWPYLNKTPWGKTICHYLCPQTLGDHSYSLNTFCGAPLWKKKKGLKYWRFSCQAYKHINFKKKKNHSIYDVNTARNTKILECFKSGMFGIVPTPQFYSCHSEMNLKVQRTSFWQWTKTLAMPTSARCPTQKKHTNSSSRCWGFPVWSIYM